MIEKQFIFINKLFHILIKKGKKAKALKTFLFLLKELKNKDIKGLTPIEIIYQSLLNVRPLLHVKKVRKSSKIYYLPQLISTEKRINIALH